MCHGYEYDRAAIDRELRSEPTEAGEVEEEETELSIAEEQEPAIDIEIITDGGEK